MLPVLKLLVLCSFTTHTLTDNPDTEPVVDSLTGNQYTSYLRGPVCTPSDNIRNPQNVDDVVGIIKEAISRNIKVKAFGHRHSATDIICTDGIPVDMREFQDINLNEDLTVSVGAGVYLYTLTTFLKENGRALKTTPAFGNITIGGAIGTGAHGSSIKFNSSISSQVLGLTIVDGLGNVQNITEEEDLLAFRIHLGLLGIVVSVTLNTEPLYKVRAHNYVSKDEILTNGTIIDIARNTDQVSIYWFPSFKKVVIANWTIVDVNARGDAITNDHVPSTSATFNAYASKLFETLQSLKSYAGLELFQGYTMQTLLRTVPDFPPIYTENGVTVRNPAVGYYDLMFAPICKDSGFKQCPWFHGPRNNLTFLDNEISLPLERVPDFARTVQDIVSKTPGIFPNIGILLRFSANSSTYMSTSQGNDACHFEFYTMKRKNPYKDPSLGLTAYQLILQSLAGNYSGKSHWGKSGFYYHTTEMLEARLEPEARASFLEKMKKFDPKGIFLNSFGERLKGVSSKIDFDPATIHCALLDNCVCSKDSDCAKGQICTTISGYPNYPVCKSKRQLNVALDPNAYLLNSTLTIEELVCSSSKIEEEVKTQLNCSSVEKQNQSLFDN